MLLTLSKFTLGPILLAQGYYTRRVTPLLPEPAGAREGSLGAGHPLKLLILGDSAAAGVGVATQQEALSGQLIATLSSHFQISWQLHAKTGHTTDDLLNHLTHFKPSRFDVVITSVGVNDVTRQLAPKQWLSRQSQFIDLIQARFDNPHVLLTSVPPMHQFPALPQPLRWYVGNHAKAFNRGLKALVSTKPNCTLLEASLDLNRANMAADGFHPGPPVYSAWAKRIAEEILVKFAPQPTDARALMQNHPGKDQALS